MSSMRTDDLYRFLLSGLPEGVILADPDGQILFVNDAAEKIRNLKKEDILGNNILGCHREASREKVLRAVQFLKEHPEKTYRRMVTDDVNEKVYENTYASVRGDEGDLVGMAVISRDVTKARKADEDKAAYMRMQQAELDSMRAQYHNLVLSTMGMLMDLMDARDQYTNGHSKRVAEIAAKLYEYRYGINEGYLDLRWAARLHDIGKICIADRILLKEGRLTDEEYEVVKQHSTIAGDLLKPLDPGDRIASAVRHHHERYDGGGYPDGLSGGHIPLGSRIIAVADAYDAMNSSRPYREAVSYERCIEEIRSNAGRQFDPEWVEIFLELADTGSIG